MLECGEVQHIEIEEEKRKELNEQRKSENLPPLSTLEDLLQKDWLVKDGVGIKPTFLVIDQGGHRANDVKHFAKKHRNVIMQKGTTMTAMNWKISENQERLVMTNEKFFKSTAIFYLYAQKNREENFLWFYPDISDEHIAEIRDVRPDETSKWGNAPENWVSKTSKDHQFDCLKYAYFARDFAVQSLSKSRYRFCKSPLLLRRFEKARKIEEHKQQEQAETKRWFSK